MPLKGGLARAPHIGLRGSYVVFPSYMGEESNGLFTIWFLPCEVLPSSFIKGDVFPFGKVRERKQRVRKGEKRDLGGIFVGHCSAQFEVPRSTTKRPPIGTIFWYVVHLIIGFILYGWIVVLSLQSHIPFASVLSWVLLISTNWVMKFGDLAKLVDA